MMSTTTIHTQNAGRTHAASFAAFLDRGDWQARLVAILAAFTLALAGLLVGVSIAAAVWNWGFINAGPGEFLVNAYGILAFMIPGYLFWAAWILSDPPFRPGRIFVLSAALFPFLTLASALYLIRASTASPGRFSLIRIMGVTGFGFAVIVLTALECFVIAAFHAIFFARRPAAVPAVTGAAAPERELPVRSLFWGNEGDMKLPRLNGHLAEQAAASEIIFDFEKKPETLKEKLNFPELTLTTSQAILEMRLFEQLALEEEAAAEAAAAEAEAAESIAAEAAAAEAAAITVETPFAAAASSAAAEVSRPLTGMSAAVVETPAVVTEVFPPRAEMPAVLERAAEAEEAEEMIKPIIIPSALLSPYSRLAGETSLENEPSSVPDDLRRSPEIAVEQPFRREAAGSEPVLEPARPEAVQPEDAGIAPSPLRRKSWPETGRKRRGAYSVPVEGVLNQYPDGQYWIIDQATQDAAGTLQDTLKEFSIEAEVTGIRKGPVITMFEILPAPGVKLSRIENLQDNIALRLAAQSVRILAPIPGKQAVGIEVPNKKRNIVSFREIIEGELRRDGKRQEIPVVLGKNITGEAVTVDLVQMPHLLIAGSTGSGKSVCVNSMILSILYQRSPADCRLILIDPKIVELKLYNDIPHLLTPVITEPKRAFQALQYCIFEMERRYACLDSMGVRDIKSYNKRIRERSIAAEHMPYIIVVIDEFADLMATTGKELESTVARLAAMSRAVGIHLVLATQRPSIDVITGLIKANIPSRIAFMVASKMDSRIIIDMVGAEKLLGKGDMLYAGAVDPFPIRMQGAFISEEEVERVVDYVKSLGEPEYIDDEIFYDDDDESSPALFSEGEDPLYDKALEVVYQQGKASASYIQRRLKIGYNRAARLVEEMEHRGVVGPAQGSRPRELLRSA